MGYGQRSFALLAFVHAFPFRYGQIGHFSHNLFLKLFRNSFFEEKKLAVGAWAVGQVHNDVADCGLWLSKAELFFSKWIQWVQFFLKDLFRKLFYSGHRHMWHACISTISWCANIPDIIIIINVINVIVTVNTHLTVIKVKITNNKYMFSATEFHHDHNCH